MKGSEFIESRAENIKLAELNSMSKSFGAKKKLARAILTLIWTFTFM